MPDNEESTRGYTPDSHTQVSPTFAPTEPCAPVGRAMMPDFKEMARKFAERWASPYPPRYEPKCAEEMEATLQSAYEAGRADARKRWAWQPIKFAPRDATPTENGTEILIGKYVGDEWRVCQASWCFFPGRNDPGGYEPDVWWWNSDADWGGITDDEGPTHWQPLPTPPETKP